MTIVTALGCSSHGKHHRHAGLSVKNMESMVYVASMGPKCKNNIGGGPCLTDLHSPRSSPPASLSGSIQEPDFGVPSWPVEQPLAMFPAWVWRAASDPALLDMSTFCQHTRAWLWCQWGWRYQLLEPRAESSPATARVTSGASLCGIFFDLLYCVTG